ncbi:MAG TPA: protein kinase [Acidobacteriaceae bacterium]|nr:protein kinase [Acidobacteriaceae bacterium]
MKAQKPDRIGKYDILEVLGRGGMGVVYRARDSRLGRIVAIKMLTEGYSGNTEMLQRFYREASQTGALRHNNIVIVFDAGDQEGEPYIVMEYVEGEPLDKTIREQKLVQREFALSIVEQVCLALAYAHRNGVIHRDVKPANVIVQRDGTAKLLDFGIARDETRVDKSLTSTGSLVGTPPYMAPERFRGAKIDGRSDIFSAGVILYLLLTGRLPFDADYPAVMDQIMRFDPPPPSELAADLPASLDTIVARALAKSPADRYADADDMAMDLHEVTEGIVRAHISELLTQAEQCFSSGDFMGAQGALHQLLRLDSQNVAGKRLLSLVGQRLTQQEKERKSQELARQAREAAGERDWQRALALCDEALALNPDTPTLVSLRKSIVDGKQTQERVSQLLQESANARKMGELTRAQSHAASARQLDPNNSQILALCRALEQEIDEKRRREELRAVMASVREHLAAKEFEEVSQLLNQAESISPDNSEVFRAKDELAMALAEERRKALVRRLEEKAALTTTVDKLRTVSSELTEALREFPNDPSLLRLRLNLEPRIKQLEDELLVRDVSRSSAELPPEEALTRVRAALVRVPGNEQLFGLESALSERVARQNRERLLAQRLGQARQAIDDRLYLEAVKILERCQAEGFSSYEVTGLLELAKSAASQRITQERLERAYTHAKRLIDEEDYGSAVQLLGKVLQQIDEPVLHRQMEEARQKQLVIEQSAGSALERAGQLMRADLFAEAVLLLEEQSAGVKRLSRVEQTLILAKKLQEAEGNYSVLAGRCYAQMGNPQGVADLKTALNPATAPDTPSSQELMKMRLRYRCEEIYGEKASSVITAARELLSQDDSLVAEAILQETASWREFAPPQAQEELRALDSEVAAAKKVLRFRKGSRR